MFSKLFYYDMEHQHKIYGKHRNGNNLIHDKNMKTEQHTPVNTTTLKRIKVNIISLLE